MNPRSKIIIASLVRYLKFQDFRIEKAADKLGVKLSNNETQFIKECYTIDMSSTEWVYILSKYTCLSNNSIAMITEIAASYVTTLCKKIEEDDFILESTTDDEFDGYPKFSDETYLKIWNLIKIQDTLITKSSSSLFSRIKINGQPKHLHPAEEPDFTIACREIVAYAMMRLWKDMKFEYKGKSVNISLERKMKFILPEDFDDSKIPYIIELYNFLDKRDRARPQIKELIVAFNYLGFSPKISTSITSRLNYHRNKNTSNFYRYANSWKVGESGIMCMKPEFENHVTSFLNSMNASVTRILRYKNKVEKIIRLSTSEIEINEIPTS